MRTKAEWDAKGLAAKYDYYADAAAGKGQSALLQGGIAGLGGVGMGAFKLFSGKQGGDDTGGDTGTNLLSGMNGTNWGDMSEFTKGFDWNSSALGDSYNPFG